MSSPPTPAEPLVAVEDVHTFYGKSHILHGGCLTVGRRMVSQIREIVEVLHREGVAILLVEQNVPLTLEASQRVYFMEKGMVRHHAVASELKVDDPVIHQYLGV